MHPICARHSDGPCALEASVASFPVRLFASRLSCAHLVPLVCRSSEDATRASDSSADVHLGEHPQTQTGPMETLPLPPPSEGSRCEGPNTLSDWKRYP
jgi:hypothetical protein